MSKRLSGFGQSCIKIIVASREQAAIVRALKSYPYISLSEACHEKDIQNFVVEQVASRRASGELHFRNPKLEDFIVSNLVSRSRGMYGPEHLSTLFRLTLYRFLWVSFQLDDLCEATSDAEIKRTIENLPEGLNKTYERILEKMRKTSSNTIRLAQRIFKWVSCARRPLLFSELKEAIAFGAGDECWDGDKVPTNPDGPRLIQSCGNLIIVDGQETVRLAHHTVRQFLLSDPADTFVDRFRFTVKEANIELRIVCVIYLNFSDFEVHVVTAS